MVNSFEYTERHFNMETEQFEDKCKWIVIPVFGNDKVIVKKRGENVPIDYITGNTKVFKVVDSPDCIYRLMKTKICAMNGADGLVNFMRECVEKDFMLALVEKVLNYMWNEMRFECL